ncbi:MAG: hypothetical protein E7563_02790 [Ruminococcaceae bacterium]|nr:hypothetical protein [Oscillospiraceae bacterium]
MKRRHDYGLYAFTGGLILLVIQFLVIAFNTLSGNSPMGDSVFVYTEQITFMGFISQLWSSLFGTILLVVLYIRRIIKGHEAMLLLVGAILWVIQFMNLYDTAYDLNKFIFRYIIGVVGVILIVITAFYEAYYIKRIEGSDSDNKE